MTFTPFESPAHVLSAGTVGIAHPIADLVAHICAVKGWLRDSDTGAVVTSSGRRIAASVDELAAEAAARGWIADKGASRHIYWEYIE